MSWWLLSTLITATSSKFYLIDTVDDKPGYKMFYFSIHPLQKYDRLFSKTNLKLKIKFALVRLDMSRNVFADKSLEKFTNTKQLTLIHATLLLT
jgi:hypothetical protein